MLISQIPNKYTNSTNLLYQEINKSKKMLIIMILWPKHQLQVIKVHFPKVQTKI